MKKFNNNFLSVVIGGIFIVVLMSLVSCKTEDYEKPKGIKMKLCTLKTHVEITVRGTGEAIIDWGDNWAPDKIDLQNSEQPCTHDFLSIFTHNIEIYGDNITELICTGNEIINSLDVSENINLEALICADNQIVSMDLSKNTHIWYVDCSDNKFTVGSLDALFLSLPDNIDGLQKYINISNNPGENICNKRIAEDKGWEVETTKH